MVLDGRKEGREIKGYRNRGREETCNIIIWDGGKRSNGFKGRQEDERGTARGRLADSGVKR